MVAQADSTLTQIKQKVRRLVIAGDPSILPDSEIERQINTFVEQDFPFSLRINEFIERKSFYTSKGIDRYAVDINTVRTLQGVALSSGKIMQWTQDYRVFESLHPKIFSSSVMSGDNSAGPYTRQVTTLPLLRKEVVVSATLSTGAVEVLQDNGSGTLVSQTSTGTGTVNYQTATVTFTFGNTVDASEEITIQFVPITLSQPYTLFFRNDEIVLRPVPDGVYKIEYDAFIIPSAFLANNQSPKINMWWQYFAFGAAKKILEERQDTESLAAILPAMREQEVLIVEQTAIQDENMRAGTIFSDPVGQRNWGQYGLQ